MIVLLECRFGRASDRNSPGQVAFASSPDQKCHRAQFIIHFSQTTAQAIAAPDSQAVVIGMLPCDAVMQTVDAT